MSKCWLDTLFMFPCSFQHTVVGWPDLWTKKIVYIKLRQMWLLFIILHPLLKYPVHICKSSSTEINKFIDLTINGLILKGAEPAA